MNLTLNFQRARISRRPLVCVYRFASESSTQDARSALLHLSPSTPLEESLDLRALPHEESNGELPAGRELRHRLSRLRTQSQPFAQTLEKATAEEIQALTPAGLSTLLRWARNLRIEGRARTRVAQQWWIPRNPGKVSSPEQEGLTYEGGGLGLSLELALLAPWSNGSLGIGLPHTQRKKGGDQEKIPIDLSFWAALEAGLLHPKKEAKNLNFLPSSARMFLQHWKPPPGVQGPQRLPAWKKQVFDQIYTLFLAPQGVELCRESFLYRWAWGLRPSPPSETGREANPSVGSSEGIDPYWIQACAQSSVPLEVVLAYLPHHPGRRTPFLVALLALPLPSRQRRAVVRLALRETVRSCLETHEPWTAAFAQVELWAHYAEANATALQTRAPEKGLQQPLLLSRAQILAQEPHGLLWRWISTVLSPPSTELPYGTLPPPLPPPWPSNLPPPPPLPQLVCGTKTFLASISSFTGFCVERWRVKPGPSTGLKTYEKSFGIDL